MWDLISNLISTSLILLIVGFLGRNLIVSFISSGVQHQYDKKLENLKSQLSQERNTELTTLKSNFDERFETQRMALAAYSDRQSALHDRKLDALEKVWSQIIEVRDLTSAELTMAEITTKEEVELFREKHPFNEDALEYIYKILGKLDPTIEQHRLYVGDPIWRYFIIHRGIMLRATYLVLKNRSEKQSENWQDDKPLENLLVAVMTEKQFADYQKLRIGKINFMRNAIEANILNVMRNQLDGDQIPEELIRKADQLPAISPSGVLDIAQST